MEGRKANEQPASDPFTSSRRESSRATKQASERQAAKQANEPHCHFRLEASAAPKGSQKTVIFHTSGQVTDLGPAAMHRRRV